MRATLALMLVLAAPCLAVADTVRLENGSTLECAILQESPKNVTVLYHSGVLRLPRSQVEAVAKDDEAGSPQAKERTPPRLPDHTTTVMTVAKQSWAADFQQIPATVIDTGVMRNVPYKSHRAGRDFEINVYGDPESPAGFEIGLHHALLNDNGAKQDCIACVCTLLGDAADRTAIRALSLEKDKTVRSGLTFEVTPPDAPDAYGCWWISVYDESALERARASKKELESITVARSSIKARALSDRTSDVDKMSQWTADDLAYARVPVVRTVVRPVVRTYGGFVYVRGYTRHNGTYVHVHPRSAPHHR